MNIKNLYRQSGNIHINVFVRFEKWRKAKKKPQQFSLRIDVKVLRFVFNWLLFWYFFYSYKQIRTSPFPAHM